MNENYNEVVILKYYTKKIMETYKGKWVSKTESEEDGVNMVDVIEVNGQEVKAIGRNFTLTELLNNYQRLENSNIKVFDPFQIDPSLVPNDAIDDSIIIDDRVEENETTKQSVFKYPEDMGSANPVLEKQQEIQIYTSEEMTVFNMIEVIRKKGNKSDNLDLVLKLDIDFSVDDLIAASEMMGFDQEVVSKVISTEIQKLLTKDKLIEIISKAL